MASPDVDDHPLTSRRPPRAQMLSVGVLPIALRIFVLLTLVVGLFVVAKVYGLPDVDTLRARVDSAGSTGWLVFVGGYALIALFPAPKSAMTLLGGLLFGWVPGAGLSLTGAFIGAFVSYELGRWLGRDAVDRLVGGRLARLDSKLKDHGFAAVLAARLVPVLPYTLINYGSGASAVRRRDYLLGTALGMVPGSLAYSALGAWGTDPRGISAGVAVLLLLTLGGGIWVRRRLKAHHKEGLVAPATARAQDHSGESEV